MSSKYFKALWFRFRNGGHLCSRLLRAGQTWPAWLCLLLLIMVVWQLSGFHFGPARVSRPYVSMDEDAVELDSFSEPAVAMSILKRHVENLYAATALRENAANEALWPAESTHVARTAADSVNWEAAESSSLHAERGRDGQSRGDPARWALAELQGRIRALHGELLQKSLLIQFHQHAWNDFLDSYLDLLRVVPEQSDVVLLGRAALACAGTCRRTDEVLDALRHFARFSQDSTTVARMQDLLAEWSAGGIRDLAANSSSV